MILSSEEKKSHKRRENPLSLTKFDDVGGYGTRDGEYVKPVTPTYTSDAAKFDDVSSHALAFGEKLPNKPVKTSAGRSFVRAAKEGAVNAVAFPGQLAARALGASPKTLRDMSAEQLFESISDEGAADYRYTRQLERGQHPTATQMGSDLGNAAGGALSGGLAKGAVTPAARQAAAREARVMLGLEKVSPREAIARQRGVAIVNAPGQRPNMRAADELAREAEKKALARSLDGGLDERAAEQLGAASEFWWANPEFADKALRARKFFENHPDRQIIQRSTEGNSGLNRYLREKDARRAKLGDAWRPNYADEERARFTNRGLEDAIANGHGYDGTVYRGVTLPDDVLDEWRARGHIRNDSILSTTADGEYVKGNAMTNIHGNTGVIMRMRSDRGSGVPVVGLSNFPHEQEVMVPSGRNWRIVGESKDADGRVILDMVEAKADPSIKPAVTGLALAGGGAAAANRKERN